MQMILVALVAFFSLALLILQVVQKEAALFHPKANSPQEKASLNYAPFRRTDPVIDAKELLKMTLVLIFLGPIRGFLSVASLIAYTIVVNVGVAFNGPLDTITPIHPFRRRIIRTGSFFSRIVLFCFGFYTIDVIGKKPAQVASNGEAAAVIVSNHVSWFDILIHMVVNGMPSFISKSGVKKLFGVGMAARAMQCCFTDRTTRSGMSDLIVKRQQDAAGVYPPFVIFPEGTTTNGEYLIHFHSGAFRGGMPVRVCFLRYPFRKFNPAWESMSILVHILRVMAQFRNYVEVHYLETYIPNEEERKDAQLYANNLRKYMAEHFKIPETDLVYKDKEAYIEMLKGNISVDNAFSTTKLHKKEE